ncbi:MAG: MarR family transcriptional regulator [Solobacterium sp.]|nr:MarR family transcriptional regulator [Solobacterium sp.]
MEFLKSVLGIYIVYLDDDALPVPSYIHARYRLQEVALDGKKAVFVYPKTEMDSVNAIKKHLERVQRTFGAPAILVPDHLTYRQRGYLLRDHIPFIVDGKQIYLPFMAVYLQERCDSERTENTSILPSAQLLLLYYIYHGCGELLTSDAVKELFFTATSISRASRQLEDLGLIQTEKRGVQKILYSEKRPQDLFEVAKSYLANPVKRTIYVPKTEIKEKLLISGGSALSEYSMLNPPAVQCYAAESVSAWEKNASGKLQNSDDQCAVELWRYDPKKLACGEAVDRLSLALALRENKDERVEEAVEEMLDSVWREIGGKRN